MKKQLLLAAFIMGGFFTANAQTTVLTQDFEGDPAEIFAQGQWGRYDLEGDQEAFFPANAVAFITDLGFTGKTTVSANFVVDEEDMATLTEGSDNALDTPAITLPADGSANLSFRIGKADATTNASTAHYSVYVLVAADYDVETAAEFAAMLDAKTPLVANDIAEDGSSVVNADLSAYAGQDIFVLFRHHNSTSFTYLIVDDVVVTTQGTVGTVDFAASTLAVFPNPATNVINVTNNEVVNNVQIVDLNGRVVKSAKVNATEAQINVSDLSAGVYMMNIATDKGTTTKKIVKN